MTKSPPSRRVPLGELRRIFNHGGFWERVQTGELHQRLVANNHPTSPLAPVPYCTRSQFIIYLNSKDQEVARVHQYLRPDGTIGASGRPDPKRVLADGILYVPSK